MIQTKHCSLFSLLAASIVLLASVFTGCSQNDDFPAPDAPAVEPGMRIAVADAASRADGDPAPLSNELINSWWMAFVAADGRIAAITTVKDCSADPVDSDALTGFTVMPGTYTVYGFANITPAELSAATGLNIAVGQTAAFDGACFNHLQRPANNGLIPMTGKTTEEVTITVDGANDFTVNVTRVFGKVEMTLRNASDLPLSLTSLTFGPLSNGGAVSLMPGSAIAAPYFPAEVVLPGPSDDVGATTTSSPIYFYTRESTLDDDEQFAVSATFTRRRGEATAPVPETLRALISRTDASYIARNEWLRIPLVVNNYIFRALVRFYPPIGGFPAYTVDEEADGRITTTFRTPGAFTILPSLYLDTAPDTPLSTASYTLDKIEELGVDGNAVPEGFFTVAPSQDATTGEITGEIGSVEGTAELRLTFTVGYGDIDPDTNKPAYEHTYTRSVFITRASSTADPEISKNFVRRDATGCVFDANQWVAPFGEFMGTQIRARLYDINSYGGFNQFTTTDPFNSASGNVKRLSLSRSEYTFAVIDATSVNEVEGYYVKDFSARANIYDWSSHSAFPATSWYGHTFGWHPEDATPQGILDIPSPTLAASEIRGTAGLVQFNQVGEQTLTFSFRRGSSGYRLNTVGVDVLNLNGNVVTSDYHFGYTGNAASNNVYTINIPAVGTYIVRYFVTSRETNSLVVPITSSGTITYSGSITTFTDRTLILINNKPVIVRTGTPHTNIHATGTLEKPITLYIAPNDNIYLTLWDFNIVVAKQQ